MDGGFWQRWLELRLQGATESTSEHLSSVHDVLGHWDCTQVMVSTLALEAVSSCELDVCIVPR